MQERMVTAWDTEDKHNEYNKKMSKIRKKRTVNACSKQIKQIEDLLGVKIVDFHKGIFLFEGIVWKPIGNGMEYLCTAWNNVPMIKISVGNSTFHFVPLAW